MSSTGCHMKPDECDGASRVTLKISDCKHDTVLRYSDINSLKIGAFTIKHPGVMDLAAEDNESIDRTTENPEPVIQQKRKEDKHSKSKNGIKNVDFKKNTGLVGFKISRKDIIVDDVTEVPELDVYERIIGKAYDNAKTYGKLPQAETVNSASHNSNTVRNVSSLSGSTSKTLFQTCHNPLEVSVCKITDSKKPKNVCGSATEIKTKIGNKSTDNQEIHQVVPKVAASILKKRRNTISLTCLTNSGKTSTVNNVNKLANNDSNTVSLRNVSHLRSSENNTSKTLLLTCHSPLEVSVCKITDSKKPKNFCGSATETKTKIGSKSTDNQEIHQVVPKVPASILKKRRNTISSTCLTNSGKTSTVNNVNKLANNDSNTVSLRNVSHLSSSENNTSKTLLLTCHNPLEASVCKITDSKKPKNVCGSATETKTKIGSKSTDNQEIHQVVPKVAASILKKRRNTISSTCLTNSGKTSTVNNVNKLANNDSNTVSLRNVSILSNSVNNTSKTLFQTCHNPLEVSVCKISDSKKPKNVCSYATEIKTKIGSKSTDNQAIHQVTPKVAASIPKRCNTISVTMTNVDDNITKESNNNKVIERKSVPSIDQDINQFAPKVAASIFKKRRDTLPSTYPENTWPVKICDKSFLRDNKIIPHSFCQTIPVLLNKAPCPDQKNSEYFSSTFPTQSIVTHRPSQEFQTNNYLHPREFQIASPRPPQIRPRRASYTSHYNNIHRLPNSQYPIFNRLMNAGAFAGNAPSYSALSPTFRHPQHPISSPFLSNSLYSLSHVSIITSPKYTQQVVNIKQGKQTIDNKMKNPASETPTVENTVSSKENNKSVKNVDTSKAKIINRPPTPSENKNILNKMNSTEQSSTKNNCNMNQAPPKKEYSPPILPILSYANIINIIKTSEYDYPLLRTWGYNRIDWINTDLYDEPDLDQNKRKINDGGSPNKKAKISISEYKKRICSYNHCK